jgi:hypothetical protein
MDAAVLRLNDILEKEIIGGPVMVEIRGALRPAANFTLKNIGLTVQS